MNPDSERAQKKAEEDRLTLQAVVLEMMSEGVLVTDDEARILITNQALDAMFGYEPGELTNQHAAILNADTPEVNARLLGEVQEQLAKKNTWQGEFNSVRKDGTLLTISAEIRAQEVSGKTYWIAVEEDITEQRQRERTRAVTEERYRSLVETITHGVSEIDTNGVITIANAAYHRIYEYSDGELVGRSILDFVATTPEREALSDYLRVLVKEQPTPTPYVGQIRAKSGKIIDIEVAWNYKREQGNVVGFTSIVTDVSQRKLLEQEQQFRSEREKLEDAVEKQMTRLNPYKLTFREFTVLHLAAQGDGDKAIADRLGISSTTVSKHIGIILKKMSATSRTEACVRALREGFLS